MRFSKMSSSVGLLTLSLFKINSANQNSNLWANPRVPVSGWFEETPTTHILQIDCLEETEEDPNAPGLSKASQFVIEGAFPPYKGYPATMFDAGLFAFGELSVHPEWRPNGSNAATFYNLNISTNLGKLQQARTAWDNIALFSANLGNNWNNNQAAISQQLDAIRTQTALMQEAQTAAQQDEIAQTLTGLNSVLTGLQQQNQALAGQYLTEQSTKANQLLTDLASITPTSAWEDNLKSVLIILTQRHLTVSDLWTTPQQNTLQAIANQCRHEGGIGVVIARAALKQFDFDDEALCPGYSEPRSDANNTLQAVLSPNPGNGRCRITFDEQVNGRLTVTDVQGRIQTGIQLVDATSVDLDTSLYPAGLYVVQIIAVENRSWSEKLLVSK